MSPSWPEERAKMAMKGLFRKVFGSNNKKRNPGACLRLNWLEDRTVPAVAAFGDSGFEAVVLSAGNFKYNALGSSWTFGGTSGISANGSGFTAGNPAAPQGNQVAFLQSQGSISHAITLAAGTY